MGKGDKKTAKGKRVMGSYGNSRKRKTAKKEIIVVKKDKPVVEKKVSTKKEASPKAETAKKTTAKKSADSKTTAKKAPAKKTTK